MKLEYKPIEEIKQYKNNPRSHDKEHVEKIANSIREFGFKVPLIIDEHGTIVAGHGRYLAAKQLELQEVPTVTTGDLTKEQVAAYRLADNKLTELSSWNFKLLEAEINSIKDIDMTDLGFEAIARSMADMAGGEDFFMDDGAWDFETKERSFTTITLNPTREEMAIIEEANRAMLKEGRKLGEEFTRILKESTYYEEL